MAAGEYIINWTDSSDVNKVPFTIQPHQIDGPGHSNSNTPLQLHGRYIVNYGEIVAENFVKLLENFSSGTAPSPTTAGMLWFDRLGGSTGDGVLRVRNASNTGWVEVGSGASGGGSGGPWGAAPGGGAVDFTATSFNNYFVDTTAAPVTATLPLTPNIGDVIGFTDVSGTFDINNFYVNPNGRLLMSDPANMRNNVKYSTFRLCYSGATYGWRIVA